MNAALLVQIGVIVLGLVLALAIRQIRHQTACLRDRTLQLGALRERVGVSDSDIDRYHAEVHPHCVEDER